ncbi:MAG: NADH-quinone oxidoreductase subunit J [Dehalococcoidia bacterium]|nr:NADH-quinone oxidoreductase subunit J [Dehalococcoidia bacterium]
MGSDLAFWVLAVTAVSGALMVVTMRSLFRAALGMILCFLSIAGLFITLTAEYLGMAQIFVYIGAIAILIIMATMLTRQVEHSNLPSPYKFPAIIGALAFLGVSIWVLLNTQWFLEKLPPIIQDITPVSTSTIGLILFGQEGLILAVEIAALLLVAAIIGAISVAKEK